MEFLSIEEIKKLDTEAASEYCQALRKYVIDTVNVSGGHLASNLGVVEISVALIRQFNSPKDKIIYDVGHQSYIHKLLTGRFFDATNLRKFNGFAGFTKKDESEHDPFGAGHSSTALSAALGFAKSARLKGEDYYSVAVIGDGAFCTGMTFEALNNISKNDNVVIILNDNDMSISKNVGAMSAYLNKIRVTNGYRSFKRKAKSAFSRIPVISKYITAFFSGLKSVIKRLLIRSTFFEDLGVYYLGPADGNDLKTVEMLIQDAKNVKGPVLIHFVTTKGKGLPEAEKNPNKYHFVSPKNCSKPVESFSERFAKILVDYSQNNSNTAAITAAMCDGTGLTVFKNKFPDRLFDVGICEEHAATFSGALSSSGILPFFAVYSTFFQRCYDQILHDVVLQKLKMVLAIDRAGLVGEDGATHHGLFDVSILLTFPDSCIYAPATLGEMKYAFDKCVSHPYLSAIRYPRGGEDPLIASAYPMPSDISLDVIRKCDVLLVTYGRITSEVISAKKIIESQGFAVTIAKFMKLKPLDFSKIEELFNSVSPKYIVGIEEAMKTGGFCEYLFSNISCSFKTMTIAISESVVPHGSVSELYDYCGISAEKIAVRVIKWIQK